MARTGPVTKDTSTVALGLAQIRVGNSAANIASTGSVLLASHSIGALASTKYTGNVDYWKLESGFPMLEDLTLPLRESSMLECEFKEISSYNLALARGIDPIASQAATFTFVRKKSTLGTTTGSVTLAQTSSGGPIDDIFIVTFKTATTASIVGEKTGWVADLANLTTISAPANGANPYFSIPANFFSGTWAINDTYVFSTTSYSAGGSYTNNHAGSINLGALSAPAYVRMEAVYTYPNGINHMYIIFPRANATSSLEIDLQGEDAAAVPLTFEAKRADSEVSGGNVAWDLSPLGRIIFD